MTKEIMAEDVFHMKNRGARIHLTRSSDREGNNVKLYREDCNLLWQKFHVVSDQKDTSPRLWLLEVNPKAYEWLFVKGHLNGAEVHSEYEGRLYVRFHPHGKLHCYLHDKQCEQLFVVRIAEMVFGMIPFVSYKETRLSFAELKYIINSRDRIWEAALKSISAIYLISDTKQGGAYVGSAYGTGGLYARWSEYGTGKFVGSGNDKILKARIGGSADYADNFVFNH